jgi:hypothetical protein
MSASSFSKNTPDKIGDSINVSGKNTLIKTETNGWCVTIADEPIDAKIDGKKFFCVRVDNAKRLWDMMFGFGFTRPKTYALMMFGFTPMETFDSKKEAYFGNNGFTGCGIYLFSGNLHYPVDKSHNIIDYKVYEQAEEFIAILTISNNGNKKEIRFLCDGNESKSSDVSEHLIGDVLFPAIVFGRNAQQVTTIPLEQIKNRTPEIERLILEQQSVCQSVCLENLFLQQQQIHLRGMKALMKLEFF